MCGLRAVLDLARVQQLHFPRKGRPGGASALGKNLGDVFEVLGTCPIALKFSGHPQPRDRLRARRNEATDGHIIGLYRHAAGRIRNDIDVVPVAHRLDCWHRQAHLRQRAAKTIFCQPVFFYSLQQRACLPRH